MTADIIILLLIELRMPGVRILVKVKAFFVKYHYDFVLNQVHRSIGAFNDLCAEEGSV